MAQFPAVQSFTGGPMHPASLRIADGSDLGIEYPKPRPDRVNGLIKTPQIIRLRLIAG
jgi:hypothetical protein